MNKIVNVASTFDKFDDLFNPKVIGELNGQMVKVAKLEGDKIPWHSHENEDELFFIIEGKLEILYRDQTFMLNPGEFLIVPRGVEHKVIAHEPVKLMLFEPASTAHTGDVQTDVTQKSLDRLDV